MCFSLFSFCAALTFLLCAVLLFVYLLFLFAVFIVSCFTVYFSFFILCRLFVMVFLVPWCPVVFASSLFFLFFVFVLCFCSCSCVFCLSPSDVCIIALPTGAQKIFLCSIVFCFCPVFWSVLLWSCPFMQTAVRSPEQPGNRQAPDITPGTAKRGAQIVKKQEIEEFQAVQHCS